MAVVNEITGLKLTKKRAQYLASFPELNPDPIVEVASSGDVTFHNGAAQKVLEDQGMNGEDFSPFLPPDLHVMIQELSQGRAVSLYREVTIKERVFGEAIHLVPHSKPCVYTRMTSPTVREPKKPYAPAGFNCRRQWTSRI